LLYIIIIPTRLRIWATKLLPATYKYSSCPKKLSTSSLHILKSSYIKASMKVIYIVIVDLTMCIIPTLHVCPAREAVYIQYCLPFMLAISKQNRLWGYTIIPNIL
jgi:hypothetical protein